MTGFTVHIETTVRISPALPHLTDAEGGASWLTQSLTLTAPGQGSLEELLPSALADVAVRASRMVPVHPRRPSWSDRRYLEFLQFEHDVNVGVYPQLRPTPPTPGHDPGPWFECPKCQEELAEEAPE